MYGGRVWADSWLLCLSRYLHSCHLSSGLWLSYILSSHQERTQLRLATFLDVIFELIIASLLKIVLIWDPSLIIWDLSLTDKTEHTMGGDRAWASCIHLAPDCLCLDWRWYIFLFCEDGTICDIGTGRLRVEVGEKMAFLPLLVHCWRFEFSQFCSNNGPLSAILLTFHLFL